MIIYLYGEDSFRSREQLKKMVGEFKQKRDPQGLNVVSINCAKEDGSKILNEMMSAPFLAEKRMVVLENLLTNNDKDLLGAILEKVKEKKCPEDIIWIFYQGDKLSRIKEVKDLEKLLQKEKFAQKFDLLKGVQFTNLIKKIIDEGDGKIQNDAVNYLSQNVGSDMWYLKGLVNQLVAYKNGSEIELKDVKLFLEEDIDDNIFNMVDAIVSGNKKLGFKLLDKQREMGEDDMKLFLMILRQFRILIQMRSFYEENPNSNSNDMAKVLGIHPFVVKKSLGMMKRYDLNKLKSLYNQLLEIDIKTKTGVAPQSLMIDLFVVNV